MGLTEIPQKMDLPAFVIAPHSRRLGSNSLDLDMYQIGQLKNLTKISSFN